MIKSNVNVRIDSDIKERAVKIFALLGLDQTTAIDMFYRQVISERGLPFQPKINSALDMQLIDALEKFPSKEYTLETDEAGNLIIDKDLHPDLYDWAVNG
jgi:DNA-damage-inducible protein J